MSKHEKLKQNIAVSGFKVKETRKGGGGGGERERERKTDRQTDREEKRRGRRLREMYAEEEGRVKGGAEVGVGDWLGERGIGWGGRGGWGGG